MVTFGIAAMSSAKGYTPVLSDSGKLPTTARSVPISLSDFRGVR
jgi:hypothetical protein